MSKQDQLKTLLTALFDCGQNAQYRTDRGIITFAEADDKKRADVEWTINELKKNGLLSADLEQSNE